MQVGEVGIARNAVEILLTSYTSEANHALGIPTTRAGTVVTSDTRVQSTVCVKTTARR